MVPLDVREHVPLSPLSTLGVGGPARHYVRVSDDDQVRAAVDWARARGLPLLVLGGGSNVVLSDEGHPGLVMHLASRGVAARPGPDRVTLTAEAGEPWDALAASAVEEGWAGFECLSGIPGLVGATPIQNVGAYGQEVSETVNDVEALDLRTGRLERLAAAECAFAYRDSRFKSADRDRFIVLRVTYALRPGGRPAVRYAELARHLEEKGVAEASLGDVREAVLALRRRKSMVLDPADPDARSVGSFFTNPIVPAAAADALEATLRREGALREGERPPRFPAGDGAVKLSAAWLIERAGLAKGYRRGNVGLSSRHTLAIVNRGGAAAAEVVALAREVRDRVRARFGITLVPEPVLVNLSID
ncbi:MAG: UDP-N-acetylenolpyruvoylglucosamine reductase [Acidobacteria bacterium]|nr:MAG: UDP-N-acetylenolpyruvoylglucosamine reductase [Acidobacteriota bacterium]